MTNLASVVNAVRAHYGDVLARTGSIGGSGTWVLDQDPARRGFPEELDCAGDQVVLARLSDIETPFGAVPTVKVLDVDGSPVIRIPVHGWRFPFPTVEHTLAVYWLLLQLGVEQVAVDASVGGVTAGPWDVVVPDDVFATEEGKVAVARLGHALQRTPWVRMGQPFCPRIRRALAASFLRLAQEEEAVGPAVFHNLIEGGLYYTTPLSVFETVAEIRHIQSLGGTVVGQSMGQEAAAARVCGICMAVINPVANHAEGLERGVWIEGGMEAFYDAIAVPMGHVVWWTLQQLVKHTGECECKSATEGADVSRLTNAR